MTYRYISDDGAKVKAWVDGVELEDAARAQLARVSVLPFIYKHVAAMPDTHFGKGATIGSVIPTRGAVIPAAVGVDIGCGMMACRTSLTAHDLPDNLDSLSDSIAAVIPHGRTNNGGPGDRGAWGTPPWHVLDMLAEDAAQQPPGRSLGARLELLAQKHPKIAKGYGDVRWRAAQHLGTLGGGNHFAEVCLDEEDRVWVMLHSGSRGMGARISNYFMELAKREMERWFIQLPDKDLAYIPEGSALFEDYIEAVTWGQRYAALNRGLMMRNALEVLRGHIGIPFTVDDDMAINCHHNYVSKENHFGQNVWVTRKGATRARLGELGVIPGSMGAKSYIVRGKGNPDSFTSSSHGAGRRMSRTQARKTFSLEDHEKATEGIVCRRDSSVIDETPGAYKSIDAVMAAQTDLVDVVHTLRQVINLKGGGDE